jgi:16S rRNA (cytidine1402-2'-O)-methyltransferase
MTIHTVKAANCLFVMLGVLYVVATPIGNLQDVTRRGISVLSSVQIIAAEDTRRTRVLLAEIGVGRVELVALHEHNESSIIARIVAALREGVDVALVSDAGTPLLSDPGFELVRRCWELQIPVVPVPGASAVSAVLSICPIPASRFYFHGFLASRDGQRRQQLAELLHRKEAVVFFEAPHRIERCLEDVAELAEARRMVIGREMTKRHESYLLGTASELLSQLRERDAVRGEFVCVIEGEAEVSAAIDMDVRRTMSILTSELAPSVAAKVGSQLLGVKRRDLYQFARSLKPGDHEE